MNLKTWLDPKTRKESWMVGRDLYDVISLMEKGIYPFCSSHTDENGNLWTVDVLDDGIAVSSIILDLNPFPKSETIVKVIQKFFSGAKPVKIGGVFYNV